ncbi:adenosylmethionine decarboxylase [uncultured Sphingomonas sp.]|uniref:adenosylmethionine decarboxylase n=1 Tax=uncultured Sphingomonas sp. TaxID=158754 RepID=UPI0025D154FA|nr:adenosylmethionine decarboxylase [uncultured Sphingomonas sp.]
MIGHHLIADLADATQLADAAQIEACLVAAAAATGATLLEVRLHSFGVGQGVTGVALLAESHISIHTWPEYGTACVDIFLCAAAHDLQAGLDAIVRRLDARVVRSTVMERSFQR